jgi:hypothetical protein
MGVAEQRHRGGFVNEFKHALEAAFGTGPVDTFQLTIDQFDGRAVAGTCFCRAEVPVAGTCFCRIERPERVPVAAAAE